MFKNGAGRPWWWPWQWVLATILLALAVAACCAPGSTSFWCKAERDALTCAGQEVGAGLLGEVGVAIATKANLEAELEKLAATYGFPVVKCVVEAVVSDLMSRPTDGGATPAAKMALGARAKAWAAKPRAAAPPPDGGPAGGAGVR